MPENRIDLNGGWTLYHFPEGDFDVPNPAALQTLGLSGVRAQVPGNVELDLERAGELPDPFFGANVRRLRPLEKHEWWYVRRFSLTDLAKDAHWTLVLEGVDMLATVWMNGVEIGRAENMLVAHHFDVAGQLQAGENNLTVRLASVFNAARHLDYDASTLSWEGREEGLHLRKAPHVWGWDILPRAVSAGLWKPVYLEMMAENDIDQLYFWTREVQENGAALGVRFQIRTSLIDLTDCSLQFHGECAGHVFDFDWPIEFIAGGCTIPVRGARLWWPRGYGQPDLYTVTTRLIQRGAVLAERRDRVGIRKLEIDRTELAGRAWQPPVLENLPARYDTEPDPASHFVIRVNSVPVMVKGSNWVPLDAFHSRDANRLEPAFRLAVDLGCNFLRCWGGNVYGEDRFFELCDEHGILVWQDFAFACCRYPQDENFLDKVRLEAEAVIKRLRNHACLALWCGDNEIDMTYLSDGLLPAHNRITREVLPRIIHRHDPFRHYVPSSPYAPPDVVPGPLAWQLTPEQHLWGPRGYYKSDFYTRHTAHFIGEMGYHGCPSVESIQKFISPAHIWPWENNDEWQVHAVYHWQHSAVDRDRIVLMANQVKALFGEIPQNLADFVFASQATQAEALKFFIESTRLRKWSTSGILWWNVIDGWPQFSDAVVDYFFDKKLAYAFIRRVQAPVCLIVGETGADGFHPLVLSNDSREAVNVRWVVRAENEILSAGEITLPANQNWQVDRLGAGKAPRVLRLAWETGGQTFTSHYLEAQPPLSLEWYREQFHNGLPG